MRAKDALSKYLQDIVKELGLAWPEKVSIEPPKDKKFGDMAVNIAMLLAKPSGMPPRQLAQKISGRLSSLSHDIQSCEIAGPGFINVTFSPAFWQQTALLVQKDGERYGQSDAGHGKKVQIEYVSANPTGPLHIGHGRGAAIGDSMARVMKLAGFNVETEYYINDAGKQMKILGLSVWVRAKEISGQSVAQPEDWYKGAYIKDIAQDLLRKEPDLLDKPDEEARNICFHYAMETILAGIKSDLRDFRVHHDHWFSEKSLVSDGSVDKAFALLKANGYLYEKDGAEWFKTTELGDDKDRVLRKSDGSLTYFASDIAYHANKFARGFDLSVDVWGADHHGYIPRMRAAVAAMGKPREAFDVILVQLVNLLQNGEQIAMSTRAGKFETLIDVIKEVGTDAARFMFLSRKSDSPLDFDLELVKQRTMDNPVYYVQYAHARICAIQRRAAEEGIQFAKESSGEFIKYLVEDMEIDLLRQLDAFPDVVASAALSLAPHHVSYYLMDLAKLLHGYYASTQVLNVESSEMRQARLALLDCVGQTLRNGLDLLGVKAPASM